MRASLGGSPPVHTAEQQIEFLGNTIRWGIMGLYDGNSGRLTTVRNDLANNKPSSMMLSCKICRIVEKSNGKARDRTTALSLVCSCTSCVLVLSDCSQLQALLPVYGPSHARAGAPSLIMLDVLSLPAFLTFICFLIHVFCFIFFIFLLFIFKSPLA